MRLKLLLPAWALATGLFATGQGLLIKPGTNFKTSGGVDIIVQNGDLTNNGTSNFSGSNIHLTGTIPALLKSKTVVNVMGLYVDKALSTASLGNDVNVANNVVLQNGLLDLNTHVINLSPTSLLVGESETSRIVGPLGGTISITVNLDAPLGDNPGNLGALFASNQDLGSVTIKRGHKLQQNSGTGTSIARFYTITPTNNSGLNTIFRLKYLDAELNGLTENTLQMWKSTNNGSTWVNEGADGRNTTQDYVSISNENSFARYTLSSASFSKHGTGKLAAPPLVDLSKISSIALTPNPVATTGKVTINALLATNSTLKVFAADGRLIMQQQAVLNKGINQININVSRLAKGMYYLVVEMSDGTVRNIPFVKQ